MDSSTCSVLETLHSLYMATRSNKSTWMLKHGLWLFFKCLSVFGFMRQFKHSSIISLFAGLPLGTSRLPKTAKVISS